MNENVEIRREGGGGEERIPKTRVCNPVKDWLAEALGGKADIFPTVRKESGTGFREGGIPKGPCQLQSILLLPSGTYHSGQDALQVQGIGGK